MSDCENYQEMISCLLDGELTEEESERLHRHLESCAECAAVYVAFTALQNTLAEDMAEPPKALASGVMSRIRKSAPKKPARIWRSVAAAACIVIIGAAVIRSGLFSRAKSAAPEAPMMMAATESVMEIRDGGAGNGAVAGAAEAPAPEPEEDMPMRYATTADAADADEIVTCEEECKAIVEEPAENFCFPADAAVPLKLSYDGQVWQYAGHTSVLPEGAQASDADTLNDFYSGKSLLGDSPEIGLFFRMDDTLYVPDGNGGWNIYTAE